MEEKQTECRICAKVMQNASLKRHMQQQQGESGEECVYQKIEEKGDYKMAVTKGQFNKYPII